MKFIADMHTHTIASTHAFSTITENAAAAERAGIRFLAMTDHGIKMPDSPYIWHFYSMDNIPRVLNNVFIFRGIEGNITSFDGDTDAGINPPGDKWLFEKLDWIVASYHHPVLMPSNKKDNTAGYIGALKNAKVEVIGHSETPDFDYDFDEVTKACADGNRLIELNAARARGADNRERYKYILESCVKNNCKIIVNSDAHFWNKIGDFEHVSAFLEQIGFPEELVVNADEQRFIQHIVERRGKNFCAEFINFCS